MITISRFSKDNPRYAEILKRNAFSEESASIVASVAGILENVRKNGDEALVRYMKEFDGVDYSARPMRLRDAEIDAAVLAVDKRFLEVVDEASANVRAYHEKQLPSNYAIQGEDGTVLERRYFPLASVGICVPAAAAPLPSSLYMSAIPALVAGVERIVVISAPREGRVYNEIVAVAAHLGIREIYGISGAQGVAALAFGTESVPRVNKIVGPGNRWVMTAKKLVYGTVGIDSLAGPSEVVIFADESANPEFVAIDLLAQAEHGTGFEAATAFVISNDMAEAIRNSVSKLVSKWNLEQAVRQSLERFGNIFVVEDLDIAAEAVEEMAPEHVELHCAAPETIIERLRTYGALFVGQSTPEAVGDYFAGSNHVLPTQGTARFASGLTVADFMRSSAIVRYSEERLARDSEKIALLARCEGLRAHELSVTLRCMDHPKGVVHE